MTRRKPVPALAVVEVGILNGTEAYITLRATHDGARRAAALLYHYVSLIDEGEIPPSPEKKEPADG